MINLLFTNLVKTNQISGKPLKPTASDNEIRRNFSIHQTIGNFCVAMNGWQLTSDYELLNLDTQKVLTSGLLDNKIVDKRTVGSLVKVEFKDLQPGKYQLTFKNISGFLSYVDRCPGKF
jgi:hypothetical protein